MNMNDKLKAKYRTNRGILGMKATPRTGNSHGPTKDKIPALVPCKRATAGAKYFQTETQPLSGRVMNVDGLTGKARMSDAS